MRNFVRWVTGKPYLPPKDVQQERDELDATKRKLHELDTRMQQLERDDPNLHVFGRLIDRRQGSRHVT